MSSFWATSQGEVIDGGTGEHTSSSPLELIPDDTNVLAIIDEGSVESTDDGKRFISLRWSVLKPSDYKGRKVFQKLWVFDLNPNKYDPDNPQHGDKERSAAIKKRDNDKRMLAAIDKNAGGQMIASGQEPSTALIAKCLLNKPMQAKVLVWKTKNRITNEDMSGNFIGQVAPRGGVDGNTEIPDKAPERPAQSSAPKPSSGSSMKREMQDDIPF